MGRPRADHTKTATPTRILEAAEAEFGDVGFGAAKLSEIAGRAGIRRPSLLYHFGSKEELYAAAVRGAFARLGAALASAMSSEGTFEARLLATVRDANAFFETSPAVARLITRELLDADGPGAAIVLDQVVPLIDVLVRFVEVEGRSSIRAGLGVRGAILCIASDLTLRAAAGPLRNPLWGESHDPEELCRALMLTEPRRG